MSGWSKHRLFHIDTHPIPQPPIPPSSRLDPRSLAAAAATCRLLADCAADETLWASAGAAAWPATWAASLAAAPSARAAFCARASLPSSLADGVEAVVFITQRVQERQGEVVGGGATVPTADEDAAARAATAAAAAADAADFEAIARALFNILPGTTSPATKKTPEYGALRTAIGWWLSARAATVVAFARAPAAELADHGGVGAALIAWPSVPWRASALAVLREAARGLSPAAAHSSVLARLDAEAGSLELALAAVALEDAEEAEAEEEGPQPPSDDEEEDAAPSAPPDTPLPPSLAWAAAGPQRARAPRPCAVVPAGVPRDHWWWLGRTPAEAGVV